MEKLIGMITKSCFSCEWWESFYGDFGSCSGIRVIEEHDYPNVQYRCIESEDKNSELITRSNFYCKGFLNKS